MTTSNGKNEGAPRAGADKAVAEKAPAPAAAPAPATCDRCGKKAVWTSDGVTASEISRCRKHLPANVKLKAPAAT